MDYGVAEQNVAIYGQEEPHYEAQQGNYNNIDHSAGIKHDSSSSDGKLFVGGIAWETSEESFSRHFRQYGEITDSVIMMDKITGRPRGFGFVTFADPEVADKVLLEDHVIDGRAVEIKRTVPREGTGVRGVSKTKKIFVGGLPLTLNEYDLTEYFSTYGNVVENQIMMDHDSGRSRGFGFVTFESEDTVEKILSSGGLHEIGGKQVEIKRAEPKRSSFDHSSESRFPRGGSRSKFSNNFASGSEGFGGGFSGNMGQGYGGYDGGYGAGYGGYGSFAGSSAGYYPGYGGYGYGGYGIGGPMYGGGGAYGGGAYGGGGYGYGGAASYGVGKGYSGSGGGYDGGKGYGDGGNGGGYGNGRATSGRFHPYRK